MASQTPVWFITGAGTGFGQSIALEALSRGHKVIATARRASSLESLKAAGADVLEFDVTAPEAVIDAKIKEAHGLYGRLTYVVNAAGYVLEGTVEEASEKEVFDQYNTNVFGTIKVSHSVIPYLRAQPTSAIANFGSLASWVGGPAMAFYNSSKWAVSGFSEALTAELAPFNIAVTCIEPGFFRTAFLHAGKRNSTARRLPDVYGGKGGAEEYRAVLDQQNDKQLGDVKKGAKTVVDVLTKTGIAEGKEIPIRVALGSDCLEVIRDKCEGTLKLLKEWEDVSVSTDHDN